MSFVSISATERSPIASPGESSRRRPFPSTDELLVRGDPETGTRQNLNLLLGVVGGKVNIGRALLVNCGCAVPT